MVKLFLFFHSFNGDAFKLFNGVIIILICLMNLNDYLISKMGYEATATLYELLDPTAQEDPIIGFDEEGLPLRANVAMEIFVSDAIDAMYGENITLTELQNESNNW